MSAQPEQNTAGDNAAPQLIDLPEIGQTTNKQARPLGNNLNVIRSVKIKLSVSLGETSLSVGELLDMKEGAALSLDRLTEEPVDILLDGQVVARGQLVAIGDNFGVRITEQPNLSAT